MAIKVESPNIRTQKAAQPDALPTVPKVSVDDVRSPVVEIGVPDVAVGGTGDAVAVEAGRPSFAEAAIGAIGTQVEAGVPNVTVADMAVPGGPAQAASPSAPAAMPARTGAQPTAAQIAGLSPEAAGTAAPVAAGAQPAEAAQRSPEIPVDMASLPVMSMSDRYAGASESFAEFDAARLEALDSGEAPAEDSPAAEETASRYIEPRMTGNNWLDQMQVSDDRSKNSFFNRVMGSFKSKRLPTFKEPSPIRQSKVKDAFKDRMKRSFAGSGVGNRIYGKAQGLPGLGLRDVGVGVQEIMAVINQNPAMMNRLIEASTGERVDISDWSSGQIHKYLEEHEVFATTFKPPNNQGQDIQRRRLRIVMSQQRGIFVHPSMAPLYTADFDGDDMEVSLDPEVAKLAKDPMDYLIGVDGKLSLDLKFLPTIIPKIAEGYAEGKTKYDYVREVILGRFSGKRFDNDHHVDELCKAILELIDTVNREDVKDVEAAQEQAWMKIVRAARKVADAVAGNPSDPLARRNARNRLMAAICGDIFEKLRQRSLEISLSSIDADIVSNDQLANPLLYDDSAVHVVIRQIASGDVPNNFQEFKVMMNGFIGNVEGKNAPFRFTADIGKMLKMDPRLQIGEEFIVDPNNDSQMKSFFESTKKYAQSVQMAKEVKKAGRSQYYTEVMRLRVIKDVKFPDDYADFRDFLAMFVNSYRTHSELINEANGVMLSNMEISDATNRGIVSPLKLEDPNNPKFIELAEPLKSIYGSYSVERMFRKLVSSGFMSTSRDLLWAGDPDARPVKLGKYSTEMPHAERHEYDYNRWKWISSKYLTYNLRRFSAENRLIRSDKETASLRKTGIFDNITEEKAQVLMLLALADKGTSEASEFNTTYYGKMRSQDDGIRHRKSGDGKADRTPMTVQMAEILTNLDKLDKRKDVSELDRTKYADDLVNLLVMSGPEMFQHFGMDTPAGFLKSKLARKMIQYAGDAEMQGGIRTTMVYEWKMSRIQEIEDRISAALSNSKGEDAVRLTQNLAFEKDRLAASSEVWRGIFKEFEAEESAGMQSVFQMMREANGSKIARSGYGGTSFMWDVPYNAQQFWNNPGDHTTLRSVIEDLDIDRETKWSIISDVVRYWENDPYLKSWEVGYQLEIGSNEAFSLGSAGKQSSQRVYLDFEEEFNRWSRRSQENLEKNIGNAAKKWSKTPGALIGTLKRLADNPWELTAVSDGMYADAVMSVFDKMYAQTEKASQNPWTNLVYAALSHQRNGGFMNDITRTDDRLLGLVRAESIGTDDIIKMLADPDFKLTVYNRYGEFAPIDRQVLLETALGRRIDNVTEQDLWEFLQTNTRIASAVRKHSACALPDSTGKGYVGAMLSTSETIASMRTGKPDPIGHVKFLMRDHPVYAAIISMSMPAKNAVARNARTRFIEVENYVASMIYRYASSPDADSAIAAEELLLSLGITEGTILNAISSDYDRFLKDTGLPLVGSDNEAAENASFTYKVAHDNLAKYIEEVRDSGVSKGLAIREIAKPSYLKVDAPSVASFWDICQELGGAKTAISTGIEGAETFNYGEWVSHISAKDSYADLEAVYDDVDQSWAGMWTSLVNADGSPVLLEIGADGKPQLTIVDHDNVPHVFSDDFSEAKKLQNRIAGKPIDSVVEIAVATPSGYVVRDRSTDSSGNPVSSLFIYMVSKRANGAETFNLKAKKAGLDGQDSIVKMQGKYRREYDDAEGRERNVDFGQLVERLRQTYRRGGLQAAKLQLAELLLRENNEYGYEDLTLSNYLCIADLMLIEGQDGNLYLRSLEMLCSAIKYRLGETVDGMTEKERIDAINGIVHDSSENGVGISMMDPLDAISSYRPSSLAGSTNGIRMKSSVFDRNYNLLEEISRSSGITPADRTAVMKRDAGLRQIKGIEDVMKRSSVVRNYHVVGFAGAFKAAADTSFKTIGPSNAIVIGDGDVAPDQIEQICRSAYDLGLTVVVSNRHIGMIPAEFLADAMPCSDVGDVLIPCFDSRLNGSEAKPYNGGRFRLFQVPYSRYTVTVEDSLNEFNLGDAQVKATRAFVDRIKVKDGGQNVMTANGLFPNVYRNERFKDCEFYTSLASPDEVAQLIASGVRCTIDYGIAEGAPGFEQRMHDVDRAIERFQQRWGEASSDGLMLGVQCEPGDIVGWAEIRIHDPYTNTDQYALSPIIPFQLSGTKRGPSQFKVDAIETIDGDRSSWQIKWTNTTDITEHNAKFFGSSGGADKGMMSFSDVLEDQRRLRDGTLVDTYVAKASTGSRRVGSDRRMKTMVSLMTLARMHGYNFAASEGAFPEDPELKDMLLHQRVPASYWRNRMSPIGNDNGDILFTYDPQLNAFLNFECRKILDEGGNPTHYLANVFTDADGNTHNTHVMWEFETMFEPGLSYEDGLLRFLHSMDNTLCPNGIGDPGDTYLFRLAKENGAIAGGYDAGVLQMQVPHAYSSTATSYTWDTVYIGMSFFGEDYSGFSRPNIDGASNFMDAMNTMAYYGIQLQEPEARLRAMWASSDLARYPGAANTFGLA